MCTPDMGFMSKRVMQLIPLRSLFPKRGTELQLLRGTAMSLRRDLAMWLASFVHFALDICCHLN